MIFLPLFLGAMIFLQAAMLRLIADQWGLGRAVLFNNLLVLILSGILFYALRIHPEWMPDFFREKGSFASVSWRHLIPAFCGLCIVAGIPFAMSRLGALQVTVLIVAAQMSCSILWDIFYEGIALSPIRLAGALLGFAGAVLVSWK